jgi:hypothetical protein
VEARQAQGGPRVTQKEPAVTAVEAPSLRWSSVRDCPRKAIYESLGSPARDRTDQEERWLYRGKSIGRDYIVWLATKYGKVHVASGGDWWVPPHLRAAEGEQAAILAEVPVRWPLGVGHMDGFLVETSTALEFLSSAHASEAMIRSKLIQLTGYATYYGPATNACLVVINPASLAEDRYPIAFDTEAFRSLYEECEDRIKQVLAWRDTSEMPARVCGKPSEAWGHFCRHAEHCFNDEPAWTEPEPAAHTDDPKLVELAQELHVAKAQERLAKEEMAGYEDHRKRIEAELAEGLPPIDSIGGFIGVGPFRVKQTHVHRKPTVDVKKAELAGALNLELLAEYMKPGAAYTTTSIERVELDKPPADLDFGDEAPWTSDDIGEAA